MEALTPEILLAAYAQGFFPMAESASARKLRWYSPDPRTILPIEAFHAPRSLLKFARKNPFRITLSTAFPEVIAFCAERSEGTWINGEIQALYSELWRQGFAHSVECWEGETLVGGLYGVALGGVFFGESMFSRRSNASKVALLHLMARLTAAEFTLCDAQFMNDHLVQFGAAEISRAAYLRRLEKAVNASPSPATRFLSVSPSSA